MGRLASDLSDLTRITYAAISYAKSNTFRGLANFTAVPHRYIDVVAAPPWPAPPVVSGMYVPVLVALAPLDRRHGAGQVNARNAHQALPMQVRQALQEVLHEGRLLLTA